MSEKRCPKCGGPAQKAWPDSDILWCKRTDDVVTACSGERRCGADRRRHNDHPTEVAAHGVADQLTAKAADASALVDAALGCASEAERANIATSLTIFAHVMAEGGDAIRAILRAALSPPPRARTAAQRR